MKYRKTIIASGIVVLSLSAITLGYITFDAKDDVTIKESRKITNNETWPVIEIDEVRTMSVEEEFPSAMPEYIIQEALHGMSHQKVHAEDKWGFLPMTQDRINRLIVVVEESRSKYGESKLYLEILNRWVDNDFSQADKDHNAIWKLQLGTVGKASGLLSADEERAFIKEHFEIENE